ncbi:MAG: hypothetical protein OXR66_05670 [Candidatus Woesearchaeota archaeon]|nr:hypothetical protein [Candidatus Woesearchaeota archaeon]
MGSILRSKRCEKRNKIVVELLLDKDEFRQLKGEMDDVYVFSERVARVPSRVSMRGRNHRTKYFLIPRQLRRKLAARGGVSCQRIDCDGKSMFVYVLDPFSDHDFAQEK